MSKFFLSYKKYFAYTGIKRYFRLDSFLLLTICSFIRLSYSSLQTPLHFYQKYNIMIFYEGISSFSYKIQLDLERIFSIMKTKIISYFVLLIAVFFLSTSAIFVKLANAPSGITAFYRLLFTSIFLLPFLIFQKDNRQALQRLTKKQWVLSLLSGLLLAIHYILWFESLHYTSVASSTVIVTLQPIFSFIGGYFLFKERHKIGAYFGCFVAIIGCTIIGFGDFQVHIMALFGDILSFLAAGFMAGYFMVGQSIRHLLPVIPYSFLGYLGSTCFLGIYSIITACPFTGYNQNTWLCFLGLATISTILGHMLFNWLLKYFSASTISMSILGEAVGTCILGYFILQETLSLGQLLGIIVILLGIGIFLKSSSSNS